MKNVFIYIYLFSMMVLLLAPTHGYACASCGCMLNPDFASSSESGLVLDLRWDYVNQNQLRTGTSTISPQAASQLVNNGNPQEVELYTRNNYLTASANYTFNSDWRLDLIVPYVIRDHSTLGTASDGVNGGARGGQYTSSTSSLGDMRVLGRYQGFDPQNKFGVVFGFKLPTGSFGMTGLSTDPTAPGPASIDRGLQPGSGTTDAIFGVSYTESIDKNWDLYTEETYQAALNSVGQYRTGDSFNGTLGARYFRWTSVTPQVQINARYIQHDSGANSDTISTGGTLLYLSPGVLVPVVGGLEVYTFFQLPIYENLLGVQLAPTYTASVGIRYVI